MTDLPKGHNNIPSDLADLVFYLLIAAHLCLLGYLSLSHGDLSGLADRGATRAFVSHGPNPAINTFIDSTISYPTPIFAGIDELLARLPGAFGERSLSFILVGLLFLSMCFVNETFSGLPELGVYSTIFTLSAPFFIALAIFANQDLMTLFLGLTLIGLAAPISDKARGNRLIPRLLFSVAFSLGAALFGGVAIPLLMVLILVFLLLPSRMAGSRLAAVTLGIASLSALALVLVEIALDPGAEQYQVFLAVLLFVSTVKSAIWHFGYLMEAPILCKEGLTTSAFLSIFVLALIFVGQQFAAAFVVFFHLTLAIFMCQADTPFLPSKWAAFVLAALLIVATSLFPWSEHSSHAMQRLWYFVAAIVLIGFAAWKVRGYSNGYLAILLVTNIAIFNIFFTERLPKMQFDAAELRYLEAYAGCMKIQADTLATINLRRDVDPVLGRLYLSASPPLEKHTWLAKIGIAGWFGGDRDLGVYTSVTQRGFRTCYFANPVP